jgi:hypothetical protein
MRMRNMVIKKLKRTNIKMGGEKEKISQQKPMKEN